MDKRIFPYLGKVGIGENEKDAKLAFESAADVCGMMAEYLKKEQPYATNSINALLHAQDSLLSFVTED